MWARFAYEYSFSATKFSLSVFLGVCPNIYIFSIWRIPFSFDVLRASNYGIFTVNKVTRVVFYFLGFIEFIQRLSFQENSSCQIFFVEAKKFQQPIKVPVENDQKASAENRIFSFWKFSLTIYGKYKYSF